MTHSTPPEPEKFGGCASPLFGTLLVVFALSIAYEAGTIDGRKSAKCDTPAAANTESEETNHE